MIKKQGYKSISKTKVIFISTVLSIVVIVVALGVIFALSPKYKMELEYQANTGIIYIHDEEGKTIELKNNQLDIQENQVVKAVIAPLEGYKITSITLNGENIEVTALQGEAQTVEIQSLTPTTTLVATFSAQTFNITTSADNNGTITDSCEVEYGTNKDIVVTANENYYISSVKINGIEMDIPFSQLLSYSNTLTNITQNYEIVAEFEEKSKSFENTEDGGIAFTGIIFGSDKEIYIPETVNGLTYTYIEETDRFQQYLVIILGADLETAFILPQTTVTATKVVDEVIEGEEYKVTYKDEFYVSWIKDGTETVTEMKEKGRYVATLTGEAKSTINSYGSDSYFADGWTYYNTGNKWWITQAPTANAESNPNLELVVPNTLKTLMHGAIDIYGVLAGSKFKEYKKVTFADDLVIGSFFFYKSSVLEEVILPSNLTQIPDGMFRHCSNLKSITLPNTVKEIGEDAFSYSAIESITIPRSVTKLNDSFYNCQNLHTITIEGNVTEDENEFNACSALTSVTFGREATKVSQQLINTFGKLDKLVITSDLETALIPYQVSYGHTIQWFLDGEETTTIKASGTYTYDYDGRVTEGYQVEEFETEDGWRYTMTDDGWAIIGVPENLENKDTIIIPDTLQTEMFGEISITAVGNDLLVHSLSENNFTITSSNGSIIRYCTLNTIGQLIKNSGDVSTLGNSNNDLIYENLVSMFDAVALSFNTFISGVGNVNSVQQMVADTSNYLNYSQFYLDAINLYNERLGGVGLQTNIQKSAVIGISEGYAITFSETNTLTNLQNVLANIFGSSDFTTFKTYIQDLSDLLIENEESASCDTISSRLKYNGAVYTQSGAFVLPFAVDSIGIDNDYLLMYLIIDANGNSAIWVDNLAAGYQLAGIEHETYNSQPEKINHSLYGISSRCEIFDVQTYVRNLNSYQTVKISDGIKIIGNYAFTNVENITKIEVPTSVSSIGNSAFANYNGTLTFGSGYSFVNVGAYAFLNNPSIEKITLSNGAKIANDAFKGCLKLAEVVIAGNVDVTAQAFTNCNQLTIITIESATTSLPTELLNKLNYVNKIVNKATLSTEVELLLQKNNLKIKWQNENGKLVETLSAVGTYTIFYTGAGVNSNISSDIFETESGWKYYSNGTNWQICGVPSGSGEIEILATLSTTLHGDINIKALGNKNEDKKVENIEKYTKVVISEGIEVISKYAFVTTTVEKVQLPSTVKEIQNNAFYNCASLEAINIPSGVETIGAQAFMGCKNTTFTLEEGFAPTTLGNGAFRDCKKLTTIDFLANVTTIENNTFWGCEGLVSISIPSHITKINTYAFASCSNLNEITINGNITKIEQFAFTSTSVKTLTIGDGVTELPSDLLDELSSVVEIINNATLTNEGEEVIALWTEIGSSKLVCEWYLDGEVVKILQATGTYIAKFIGFASSESHFTTQEGWKYYTDTTAWYIEGFPSGSGTITVPATLSTDEFGQITIKGVARTQQTANFNSYTNVVLSEGLVEIKTATFEGASLIESITLPSSLTVIGSDAFKDCTSLQSVEISSSIEKIGTYAFSNCTSLNSVVYDTNAYASNVFSGCTSLTTLTLDKNATSLPETFISDSNFNYLREIINNAELENEITLLSDDGTFKLTWSLDNEEKTTVSAKGTYVASYNGQTVDGGNYGPYTTEDGWEFATMGEYWVITGVKTGQGTTVEIPATLNTKEFGTIAIKGIGSFNNAKVGNIENYSNLVISDGIEVIRHMVFKDCLNLQSISIPKSVTAINQEAFSGCENAVFTFEEGSQVETATGAFQNCKKLASITLKAEETPFSNDTFLNCNALTEVTINSDVTTVFANTFSGCGALTTVNIGKEVTTLTSELFANGCLSTVTYIDVEEGNTSYIVTSKNGVYGLYNQDENGNATGTVIKVLPANAVEQDGFIFKINGEEGNKFITITGSVLSGTVTIPSTITVGEDELTVKEIAHGAFKQNNMTELFINAEVYLYENAFYGCSNLTKIVINNNIEIETTSAVTSPFYGCKNVTTLAIGGVTTTLPEKLFDTYILDDITTFEVMINTNFTVENGMLFNGDKSILYSVERDVASVVLPSTVKTIANRALYNRAHITSLQLNEGLETISAYAIYNCTALTGIITLPSTLTTIGSWGFAKNSEITQINVLSENLAVGDSAFRECSKANFVFADNIKFVEIGNQAFQDCLVLTEIKLDYDVHPNAFNGCKSIEKVAIGKNVTSFPSSLVKNASNKISTIIIEEGNQTFVLGTLNEVYGLYEKDEEGNPNGTVIIELN